MAQPSTPNSSPQPSSGEKRFFRSREIIDFIDPTEITIATEEVNGVKSEYRLDTLIARRKEIIFAKHELNLTDSNVETLVNGTIDQIMPVTDEERDDPSRTGRASRRERLRNALSTEDDEMFAKVCASYMLDEARHQSKRFKPNMEQIKLLVESNFDATGKYEAELTDEERNQAFDTLEAYGEQFVTDMVKRSKRSLEVAGRHEKIEVNREKLADMLSGLASEHYFRLDDSLSDEQKAQEVDRVIALTSEHIISRIEAERAAEYEKSWSAKKWFYDKWASWSQEKGLITKGKLKKTAAFAIPSAIAVPVAATLLAPVVTVGAATAGVGALTFMGARSVGRRLAGAKLDRASNITTVAHEQAELLRAGINKKKSTEQDRPVGEVDGSDEQKARIELNVDHNAILEMIDKQSDYIRQRNLRRNLTGTAIALTVGLLSSRAAGAVEGLVNYIQDANPFDDEASGGGDEKEGGVNRDRDGDGVPNRDDYAPNNPDVQTPSDIDGGPGADTLDRSDMFDGHQGSREFTAEGQKDFNRWISRNGGYEVKPGDSVWKLSERYLQANGNPNPTVYEVDAVKDSVLKEFKAKGVADSRGWLTTGDTIKIK